MKAFSDSHHHTPPPRTRKPLSCTECTRRKIRCDKKIPCRACSERGTPGSCQRRRVTASRPQPGGPVALPANPDIYAELASLRSRLEIVESELNLRRHDKDETPTESDDAGEDNSPVKENGLVGAMEEAALGIGQNRRWQGDSLVMHSAPPSSSRTGHAWYDSMPLAKCLQSLPSRDEAQFLLDYYCEYVNWICGCLHEPSLRRQHEAFWAAYEQGQPRDDMSIAIIFAVYSMAGYFLGEQQTHLGEHDLHRFRESASTWFDCSLATFFRCDGLTHPSLVACQAILALKYSFHLSGNTRIHGATTHLLIGFARTMNLHLLGGQRVGTKDQILKRELGRRVWWNIVQGEWYFLPYHRYTSVAPHQFNTALPELTDDGQIASASTGTHSLSFFLALSRSSMLLYELYGMLPPSEHPSYDAVLTVSRKLDDIVDQLPDELHRTAETESRDDVGSHPGNTYVRRFLNMMLAYRSYLIHRTYYVKSLRDPAYRQSHAACLRAAETILTLSDKGLPPTFYRLWNTTLWLVAAGIVLSLDLIHAAGSKRSFPDIAARRRRLDGLVDVLENLADNSGIGSRGAKLVSRLCVIERAISDGSGSGPHFTRDDILKLVRPNALDGSARSQGGTRQATDAQECESFPMIEVTEATEASSAPSEIGTMMDETGVAYNETSFLPSLWGDVGEMAVMGGEELETFGPLVERTQYSDVFSFFEGSHMN